MDMQVTSTGTVIHIMKLASVMYSPPSRYTWYLSNDKGWDYIGEQSVQLSHDRAPTFELVHPHHPEIVSSAKCLPNTYPIITYMVS